MGFEEKHDEPGPLSPLPVAERVLRAYERGLRIRPGSSIFPSSTSGELSPQFVRDGLLLVQRQPHVPCAYLLPRFLLSLLDSGRFIREATRQSGVHNR